MLIGRAEVKIFQLKSEV